jgi:hypothetical protein
MANTSIKNAFERMWAHITGTFAKKTEVAEIIDDLGAVTIDIDDSQNGIASSVNADTLAGYSINNFLTYNIGENDNEVVEEIANAQTFGGQLPEYYAKSSEVQNLTNNTMLKTGGEFIGNVTMAKKNMKYQISDNVFVLVGYSNGEFVVSTNNNGTWNELVRLNADGSVKGGLLMPKTGGTFSGEVHSSNGTAHPAGGYFRNIEVWNSANNAQISTGLLHMVRK